MPAHSSSSDAPHRPNTASTLPNTPKPFALNAEKQLAPLKNIPRLYNAFIYQDEPFHWGPKSFGYNSEVKAEFMKRYGYELPPDLDSVRHDPRKWQDVIDFRSSYFPDGWRQVYAITKEINPNFKTVLTHDSHNTFGAGYSSHSEIAIDDVFHWGGDFSDIFVFDIYPYMMFDFRFGRPSQLPQPRISQTHYSFAQMRNLTRSYGKELGFWVGTYNPAWFEPYFCPELEAMSWSEREMSMTAVAAGADFLLTGYKIPVDPGHWEAFGEGLRLLQQAGARLLDAPKIKAKACMLFPRTQYIQLQQEYFNVGLSFELFLRAFGELDILHEDQVTDDTLHGYELLLLFDVELLPEDVAGTYREFRARRRRRHCRLRAASQRRQATDVHDGGTLRRPRRPSRPHPPLGTLGPVQDTGARYGPTGPPTFPTRPIYATDTLHADSARRSPRSHARQPTALHGHDRTTAGRHRLGSTGGRPPERRPRTGLPVRLLSPGHLLQDLGRR